jgi:exodeoxyribonuclease VII large subunit
VAHAAEALEGASDAALRRRRATLDALARTLAAHDPQRTLERGYALVEDPDGAPVTSAAAASSLDRMTLRLHDGSLPIRRDDAPGAR